MFSSSSFIACFFFFFSLLKLVAAHGYVHQVIANGQSYPGWNPFSDPYLNNPAKAVRKILNDGFVGGGDPDLACNHEGKDGVSQVAEAEAGSQITFDWTYWPGDHQGPVSTYMAACDNGDCTTFTTDNARWFKLDATGYENGQWAAAKLIADGQKWVSTIPAGLVPGQYLIRNEIIALHSITPQYYPSCAQLKVTGTGTGKPSDSDLVSIPALYDGVKFPNIYLDNSADFVMPGPAPVTFGQAGTNPSPSNPPPSQAPAATSATSTVIGSSPTQAQSQSSAPVSTPAPSNQCVLGSRKLFRRRSLEKRHRVA